jgi:hypothetical protein
MQRYSSLTHFDRSAISDWLPLVAAARLDEGIQVEEPRLLSIAQNLLKE